MFRVYLFLACVFTRLSSELTLETEPGVVPASIADTASVTRIAGGRVSSSKDSPQIYNLAEEAAKRNNKDMLLKLTNEQSEIPLAVGTQSLSRRKTLQGQIVFFKSPANFQDTINFSRRRKRKLEQGMKSKETVEKLDINVNKEFDRHEVIHSMERSLLPLSHSRHQDNLFEGSRASKFEAKHAVNIGEKGFFSATHTGRPQILFSLIKTFLQTLAADANQEPLCPMTSIPMTRFKMAYERTTAGRPLKQIHEANTHSHAPAAWGETEGRLVRHRRQQDRKTPFQQSANKATSGETEGRLVRHRKKQDRKTPFRQSADKATSGETEGIRHRRQQDHKTPFQQSADKAASGEIEERLVRHRRQQDYETPFQQFADEDERAALTRAFLAKTGEACGFGGFPKSTTAHGAITHCRCDAFCALVGDCCPDKAFFDPDLANVTEVPTKCLSSSFMSSSEDDPSYVVVSGCPPSTSTSKNGKKCSEASLFDWNSQIPVSDQNTGIHYKNKYCAKCNDASSLRGWRLTVSCSSKVLLVNPGNIATAVKAVLLEKGCSARFAAQVPESARFCHQSQLDYVSSCNVTGLWAYYDVRTERACSEYKFGQQDGDYRNIFCRLCNSPDTWTEFLYEGQLTTTTASPEDAGESTTTIGVPLLAMLDFDNSETADRTAATRILPYLGNDTVMNPLTGSVRELSCPEGKTLVEGGCRSDLQETNAFSYVFCVRAETSDVNGFRSQFHQLALAFRHVNLTSTGAFYYESNSSAASGSQCEGGTTEDPNAFVVYASTVLASQKMLNRDRTEDRLVTVADSFLGILNVMANTRASLSSSRCFGLGDQDTAKKKNAKCTGFTFQEDVFVVSKGFSTFLGGTFRRAVSPLLTCRHVTLNASEYELQSYAWNPQLLVKDTGVVLDDGHFAFSDTDLGEVHVCAEDYLPGGATEGVESLSFLSWRGALGVVSLCVSCVSLACLVLVLLTYLVLAELRTNAGQNTVTLATLLLLAQTCSTFGGNPAQDWVCEFTGIVTHFLWLASSFACVVCTYRVSMCLAFPLRSHVNRQTRLRSLLTSLAFSLGLSAATVAITTAVHEALQSNSGYGRVPGVCFLQSGIGRLLAFGLPVAGTVLVNLALLFTTVYRLWRLPTLSSTGERRLGLLVYVKISVLTGGSWLFGYLYEISGKPALAYVFIIMGNAHGLLLLLAFVTNRRVLRMWRGRLCALIAKKPSQDKVPAARPEGGKNSSTSTTPASADSRDGRASPLSQATLVMSDMSMPVSTPPPSRGSRF